MTDPTIVAPIVTSAGLTILGVATGLQPELLLLGFVGGLWYQSYLDPMSLYKRIIAAIASAFVAAYVAPAVSQLGVVIALSATGHKFEVNTLEPCFALGIGLLTYGVIGPMLLKLANKKVTDLTGGEK